MHSPHTRFLHVRFYSVLLVALLVATLVSFYFYWLYDSPKWAPIIGGLFTGFLVASVDFLLQWHEQREMERFKALGILRIMPHRDEREYYQKLLDGAQSDVLVIANTAFRLMNDFADKDRPDRRSLIQAMARTVKVRILVPTEANLPQENRVLLQRSLERMRQLKADYPDAFEVRFYDHPPVHSLVKIDKNCLVGPVFPGVESRDSPTIHAYDDSPLVKKYLQYFEKEWSLAQPADATN